MSKVLSKPVPSKFRNTAVSLCAFSVLTFCGCTKHVVVTDLGKTDNPKKTEELTKKITKEIESDNYNMKAFLRRAVDEDGNLLFTETGEKLYSGTSLPDAFTKKKDGTIVHTSVYVVWEKPVEKDNITEAKIADTVYSLSEAREMEKTLSVVYGKLNNVRNYNNKQYGAKKYLESLLDNKI